jgi:hypothetical protein
LLVALAPAPALTQACAASTYSVLRQDADGIPDVCDIAVRSARQSIMDSRELTASGLVAELLSRGSGSEPTAIAVADFTAAQFLLVGAIGCAATITWWQYMQVS